MPNPNPSIMANILYMVRDDRGRTSTRSAAVDLAPIVTGFAAADGHHGAQSVVRKDEAIVT